MRVHVALTPDDPGAIALDGQVAIVVDVLRATTSVVAACAAGCLGVVPASDEQTALIVAGRFSRAEVLLAGERGGDPIPGFDLGNSPLEYTADRVAGRTIILTTTNGTATMTRAGLARAGAIAALTNVRAAADWALDQGGDITVLCAGDDGALSLEDAVCAGLLAERLRTQMSDVELSAAAELACHLGGYYARRVDDIRIHSRWARRLAKARAADVDACLAVDTSRMVPVFEGAVVVPGRATGAITTGAVRGGSGAEASA
jgi:2-phosphosulfolactate phosphatase